MNKKIESIFIFINIVLLIFIVPLIGSHQIASIPDQREHLYTSELDPGDGGSGDKLQWGVDEIDAEIVWGGYDGAVDVLPDKQAGDYVKVCIIDTGIDRDHVDLDDNIKGGDSNNPIVGNYDDILWHGSHCAGIIGAEDNNCGIIGVAPKASLYGYRMFYYKDGNPKLQGDYDDLIAGILWAIEHKMDVISMSVGWWGIDVDIYALNTVCQIAISKGIVLVASAGNFQEGDPSYKTSLQYPAKCDNVIAVGAIDQDRERSTWVEGPDSILHPCVGDDYDLDFVAPGTRIFSSVIDGWDYSNGTSMACPHVAGVCALMLSVNPHLTPANIWTILYDTCKDLGVPGWDPYYGWGMVNATAAVEMANSAQYKEDTIAPTVSILKPTESVVLIGQNVLLKASVKDNDVIKRVDFRINNGPWHEDTTAPYEYTWIPSIYEIGTCKLYYRAWDKWGNIAVAQKTVTAKIPRGDAGCPILFVYDGSEYIVEGLLDIHNPEGIDVKTNHTLITKPETVSNRFLLRLIEHPQTISHIDRVRLFGRLHNGLLIPIRLISADHSTLGQVRWKLWFSDDKRVDVLGADHNEGFSESIDLQFIAPSHRRFTEFIFYIEGNNILVK